MEAEAEVIPSMKGDLEPGDTGSLWELEETRRVFSPSSRRGTVLPVASVLPCKTHL